MMKRQGVGRAGVRPRVVVRYKPQAFQVAFHRDRLRYRFRALLAGTGGGKTYAGLAEGLAWAMKYPGSVGIIVEPDYKMIERVIVPKLCALLGVSDLGRSPAVESYNQQHHRLRFVNGSVVWLLGVEHPEKAEGPDVDWVMVDEAWQVRHWERTWKTLRRRLRGTGKGYPNGAWVCTHSPTKAIYEFFEGGVDTRHPSAKVYRWPSRANERVPSDYLEDIERAHTGAAAKAALEGLYVRAEGLVYSEFNPGDHVRAAPEKWDRVSYGVDWGWTQPAALLAVAWWGEQAFVVEEYYRSYATIQELVFAARAMQTRWGRGTWWCGPDQPRHIADFKAAGMDAKPYVGKVADGVGILNSMYRGNELSIAPECEKTLVEIEAYSFETGGGKEGVPAKGNDHAMDAKRYGVMGGRGSNRRVVIG